MGDKDMCFYMSIIKDKESLSVATTTTAFRDHTTLNLEHQDTVPTSDDDQSSDHYDDSSLEKRQGTVPPREEYRSTSLEICSFVSPYLGVSPKCHLLKTKKWWCVNPLWKKLPRSQRRFCKMKSYLHFILRLCGTPTLNTLFSISHLFISLFLVIQPWRVVYSSLADTKLIPKISCKTTAQQNMWLFLLRISKSWISRPKTLSFPTPRKMLRSHLQKLLRVNWRCTSICTTKNLWRKIMKCSPGRMVGIDFQWQMKITPALIRISCLTTP